MHQKPIHPRRSFGARRTAVEIARKHFDAKRPKGMRESEIVETLECLRQVEDMLVTLEMEPSLAQDIHRLISRANQASESS